MKYINADKLKQAIGYDKAYIITPKLFKLNDELSEEREDVFSKTRLALREYILANQEKVKADLEEMRLKSTQQPNPLKVAIKGDGTEEYGKKIIEYYKAKKVDTNNLKCYYGFFYANDNNALKNANFLPEGYTEISLKEEESWLDKDERLFHKEDEKVVTDNSKVNTYSLKILEKLERDYTTKLKYVSELETDHAALCKELTDLKLKLKDLING